VSNGGGVTERLQGSFGPASFARRVSLIAGGAALGQALIALASPLLTRLYTPPELGLFAVYAALLSSLVPAASLRYDVAIPLPTDEDDAVNLLAVAMACLVLISLLLVGVVLLAGESVSGLTGSAALGRFLWILPLGLLAAGTYQAFSYWAVRNATFGLIGKTRLVQACGQVGSQLALGVSGLGAGGLLFGDVLGRLGGASTIASAAFHGHPKARRHITRSRMRVVASRYRRFPLFGTWSALANSAGLHLTPFLVAVTFGVREAGWFTVGQRVMALPATIVGLAVGQVYLHDAAAAVRTDLATLRLLYIQTARKLTLFGILIFVPIALLAPMAFARVFGAEWQRAGVYAQVTAMVFLLQLVVSPLSQTLNVIGRQDVQLVWDVSRLVGMIALFWIAREAGWTDLFTLSIFAMVMTVMYLGLGIVTLRLIRAPTIRQGLG
jgi:O-antigen/teichoic acid export membrane protein